MTTETFNVNELIRSLKELPRPTRRGERVSFVVSERLAVLNDTGTDPKNETVRQFTVVAVPFNKSNTWDPEWLEWELEL